MTPDRWKKIKRILEEVAEAAPGSRASILDRVCGEDDGLRFEVKSLLDFEDTAADLLEDSAVEAITRNGRGASGAAFLGRQIGNYRIISELGEGGMGVVFLAERSDGSFDQKVALKIIKRSIESDSAHRRFVNERQILASLDHPNIAHLVDGGTTEEGLPYFVLEYVEGEAIIEFASRNKLTIDERLDLFRQVCSAVSYAHQNLVIHRDLKPSNIIVNSHGVPKLLDFGIAKLLKVEISDQTATQHFVFTPEYASPEQVRGESLTTATDIYSLGAVLYELLTGVRPFSFKNKNFGQIIQTVTQTDPVRPSDASIQRRKPIQKEETNEATSQDFAATILLPVSISQLRGDLDNIILKALKRDTERRYSSVEQFSEDIRRHLRGLPVTARPDTFSYRAEKFAGRNPLVVVATGIALLILIVGIIGVGWQWQIANAERAKAEQRFTDVRNLANSFIFEINEKIDESPIKARELLVIRAIEYLDKLAAEAEGDAGLQSELATAYEKIGDVQSKLFNPSIGKSSEALISHQKSLAIREKLLAAEPNSIGRGLDVSKSLSSVGDILSMSGRVAEAADNYRNAITLNERFLRFDENNRLLRRALAGNFARLGQSVLRSGSLNDALANYNRSLEIYRALLLEIPSDVDLQKSLTIIFSYIGYVRMEMGDHQESVRSFGEALDLTKILDSVSSTNYQSRGNIASAQLWFGVALREQGKPDDALIHIRQALEILTTAFETDKGNVGLQNGVADCNLELGKALIKKAETQAATRSSSTDGAIVAYEIAIKHYDSVWQTDRQNLSARRQIAFTRINLADAWRLKGQDRPALQIFHKALDEMRDLTQKDPNNTEWQHDLAFCNLKIGEILWAARERAQAVSHSQQANLSLEVLSAASPENVRLRRDLDAARILKAKAMPAAGL